MNKKSEGVSEILSWVSRSRKLEDKRNAEKEKAFQLSKVFEEQVSFVFAVSICTTFYKTIDFMREFSLISWYEFSQDNIGQGDSDDEEPGQRTARNSSYSLKTFCLFHQIDLLGVWATWN